MGNNTAPYVLYVHDIIAEAVRVRNMAGSREISERY